MKGEIRWSERASRDLEQIEDYVALRSPDNAEGLVDRILDRVEALRDFPELGPAVPKRARDGLRELVESPYRIIYRVLIDRTVQVVTIHHGSRRLPRDL